MITQYYSKWRNEWINFSQEPNQEIIDIHLKFNYQLR